MPIRWSIISPPILFFACSDLLIRIKRQEIHGFTSTHVVLTNDALIVAAMQANVLTNLASNDKDFNRVPGLVRYAPA
jgi:predicted nucleic acid-binding protein